MWSGAVAMMCCLVEKVTTGSTAGVVALTFVVDHKVNPDEL